MAPDITMSHPISTEISTPVLTYAPGGQPATFEVTVRNRSDRFAAFRLELLAAGSDQTSKMRWYRLAPEVSSKIPVGDRTRFQVEILTIPPVPDGFTGTMNITVRVYSIELQTEDRQVLRLVIQGTGYLPPRLTLPVTKLQGYPGERIEIPVSVVNPNRQAIDVVLRLSGLYREWLRDGMEQHLHLLARGSKDTTFVCHLPAPPKAPSQDYPFTLEAFQSRASMPVYAQGLLSVLPAGYVELRCQPSRPTLPQRLRRWLNRYRSTTSVEVILDNRSNLAHRAELFACYESDQPRHQPRRRWGLTWPWKRQLLVTENTTSEAPAELSLSQRPLDPGLSLSARETAIALDSQSVETLTIERTLPWIGGTRLRQVEVKAVLTDGRTDLRNDLQIIDLEIFPLIPIWLQSVAAALLVAIAAFIWWEVNQVHHLGAVTSVQFNGQADEVTSVAKDGRIRLWSVRGDRLRPEKPLNRRSEDRSLRVVRYRPVDNDQVVVGFENGELETWDLLLQRPQLAMSIDQDDRVFDVVVPPDAQSMYSGHGSGLVVQWNLQPEGEAAPAEPLMGYELGFAIETLALVGGDRQHLAVGGRNNRLLLLDLATEASQPLDYRNGGPNDYVMSLDSPDQRPYLLAASDNQGYISLWNLQPCLTSTAPCALLDEWSSGHNGETVRAIAFTTDGCFLASAGDDGQVKLWPLTAEGYRLPALAEGKRVQRFDDPINAVDVSRTRRHLLVASGAETGYVRLHRLRLSSAAEAGACPSL